MLMGKKLPPTSSWDVPGLTRARYSGRISEECKKFKDIQPLRSHSSLSLPDVLWILSITKSTCCIMDIEVGRHFYDVPGAGLPVVGEVHVVLVVEQAEADLVAGEGPVPELHDAGLLVKGEVRHVNRARGLQWKSVSKIDRDRNLQRQIFKVYSSRDLKLSLRHLRQQIKFIKKNSV